MTQPDNNKELHSFVKLAIAYLGIMTGFAVLVAGLALMANGNAYANSGTEAYRAVKISDFFLQGVGGMITVKSITLTDHKDYHVYVNFSQESSSLGAGYFVSKDTLGNTIYWNLIYSKKGTGPVTHDLYTTVPIGYTFLADVRQVSNGSNCYKATTYNNNNKTVCFNSSTTSATTAGAIVRGGATASSSNQASGLMDYLQTKYYNNGYTGKYFTDALTNESKCQSIASYVEDDLLKRAPSGSSSSKFDKIGWGPTLYTQDDCISNSPVWSPYGST